VAPENLLACLRTVNEWCIGRDRDIGLGFTYIIIELVGNMLFQSFRRQLASKSFIPPNDMYKKRPENLDVKLPVLYCVQNGRMMTIYIP
jgi:hypothetical protein